MNHGVPWAFQLWLSSDGDGDPEVVAILEKRVWRSPGLTECGSGTAVDTFFVRRVKQNLVGNFLKSAHYKSHGK